MDPLRSISTRRTPQSEPADRRQVLNSAGGYAFTVSDAQRLRRFLTLGVDAPTYYSAAPELAKDSAAFLIDLAERDHGTLLTGILQVSMTGAAHRQHATLFAYAIACSVGTDRERGGALSVLNTVVRTGTHLFLFAGYVEQFRGWGRALRRAVAGWYLDRPVDELAYQMVKYRQREGWTHRDLLRLSHPKSDEELRRGLFAWATTGETEAVAVPPLVHAFEEVQADPSKAVALAATPGTSWEMLPTEALGRAPVWDELLLAGNVPLGALIRQLPRLTRLGLFLEGVRARDLVVDALTDWEQVRKSRLHPMAILVALRTYAQGRNEHGSSWEPSRHVIDALDEAFYLAFDNVKPTGKRILIALDVSGSMGWERTSSGITAREAGAAMSMVTLATEQGADIVGFTSGGSHRASFGGGDLGVSPLPISPRQRLDDVVRSVSDLPFGRTDCAAPMLWAAKQGRAYDAFVVLTDNETWHGPMHPHQALRAYRATSGIHDAKLVVAAMTPTQFTIADPSDPGMLDVVGMDVAAPAVISDFIRD